MIKTAMTVVGFMVVSFGVQGASHFVVNVDHYAGIDFARPDPVLPLGFAVMTLQALVFASVVQHLWPNGITLKQAALTSASFGVFLGSYIALTEPAKYAAPSIPDWILIEATASTLQFALFTPVLWWIYRWR